MDEEIIRASEAYRHINGELSRSNVWLAKYSTAAGVFLSIASILFPWGDGSTDPVAQRAIGATLTVLCAIWWMAAADREKRLRRDKSSIEKLVDRRGYSIRDDGTLVRRSAG